MKLGNLGFALVILVSFSVSLAQEETKEKTAEEAKPTPQNNAVPAEAEGMTNEKLDILIKKVAEDVGGQPGAWTFTVLGTEMMCLTDERAGRMRIIAPIKLAKDMKPEEVDACMNANFDRALDARYCINGGTLWSAFIHPLGDLSPDLFFSALLQVAGAKLNYGSSYSSGGLQFGNTQDESEEGEEDETKDGKKSTDPPTILL